MEKKCRLCGSDKIDLIKRGVRDNAEIDVFKCQKCGLEFLSQTSQADEEFYTHGGMHCAYNTESWFKNTYTDDYRRALFLKNIIRNKNVLDFGTGNGGFLIQADKFAKNVYGCDLDVSLDEHYKAHNLNVKHSIEDFGQNFDVITMFHVLEHIELPEKVLEGLKKYLNKNGKLIIEVPNSDDALLTFYKSEAFKNFTYWSCHLYAYNSKNVKTVLKNSGYKINRIEYVQRYPYTNHKGWLKDKLLGGHKKYKTNEFINTLYKLVLKFTKKTDTLLIIASC